MMNAPQELVIAQTWSRGEDERSLRDARALVSFKHANVAKVREVVEDGVDIRMTTQFVEGESLAALRKAGRVPLAIELRILVDVLTGLAALHAAKDAKLKPLGFVHAEMAPANVIVGLDGVARVIQLAGLNAAPGAQGADSMAHLAPEILLADDAVDARVDVYGVGVMLWEALNGTSLFKEKATGAIVTSHLSGRIQKAAAPADSPWAAPLVDVAMKAIATDPKGRHATANELAAEIKRIAKTNLAPAAKVAALVKERGASTIEARKTALGEGEGRASTGARPKIAPKPHIAAPPKVEEADIGWSLPPPSYEPVSSSDVETAPETSELIPIDSDDLEDSAVKSRPQPSVHDRITDPNLIDARALDAAVATEETTVRGATAPVVIQPAKHVFPPHDPLPAIAPPKTPAVIPPAPIAAPVAAKKPEPKAPALAPAVPVVTQMALAAPPLPVIAAPKPPVVEAPAATTSLPPVAVPSVAAAPSPMFAPVPEATLPLDEPIAPANADRDKRRKRAAVIFLLCAFLFCVIAIAARPKKGEPEAKKPPVTKPIETAAKIDPIPEPAAPAAAPETAPLPVASADPPPKAAETAEKPADPPPAAAVPAGKPATTSKAKPKPTYDPLGI